MEIEPDSDTVRMPVYGIQSRVWSFFEVFSLCVRDSCQKKNHINFRLSMCSCYCCEIVTVPSCGLTDQRAYNVGMLGHIDKVSPL